MQRNYPQRHRGGHHLQFGRGRMGESFWVRVRVVIDGMIVLGWAPAVDVLE
jgi:hypothetical protein